MARAQDSSPQLACTGRLWDSATQVAWSRDRALEAREHTLAEQWIPRRHIGKGTGQPPQLVSTRLLQGRATQSRGQSTGHAREHTLAELAVDPAETHWQGPMTAAAANLHRAAAGQGISSQDREHEAREHARRAVDPAKTHWQGPRTAAAASLHKAAAGQGDSSQDRALEARKHACRAVDPS